MMVVTISISIRELEDCIFSRLPDISGFEQPHLCINIDKKLKPGGLHYWKKIVAEGYDTISVISSF